MSGGKTQTAGGKKTRAAFGPQTAGRKAGAAGGNIRADDKTRACSEKTRSDGAEDRVDGCKTSRNGGKTSTACTGSTSMARIVGCGRAAIDVVFHSSLSNAYRQSSQSVDDS